MFSLTKPCVMRGRRKKKGGCRNARTDEDGLILSLKRLCLMSLADNMQTVWVKDYADKYLDQYSFRYIMGPFNLLPGELVEELTQLLCTQKQLSRPALHLLLVPQLRGLSLESCPSLVTPALCAHITARCQGLCRLDFSGVQQLSSKALCETLSCLPALRSLSLAGSGCDRGVIDTIARHCRCLRHLDVSRCNSLPPAALLPLVVDTSTICGTCTSPPPGSFATSTLVPPPPPPLPLTSLLALDIGLGEDEGDSAAAAAYLLLSLPGLERLAVEGLAQACWIIDCREFRSTHGFSDRAGVPRLEEVWRERGNREDVDGRWRMREEDAAEDEKEWEETCDERGEPVLPQNWADGKRGESGNEHFKLHLRDVQGVTCDSLESLSCLCPNVRSLSVDAERGRVSVLAAALQTWSGHLLSLSVQYPGPLGDLLPAVRVVGSSLHSLTLEGVKTSVHSPLLQFIEACPRLKDLLVFAEFSPPPQAEEEEEEDDDEDPLDVRGLPRLPHLRSLTLKFEPSDNRMPFARPWPSLRRVISCLLIGSPLLEKLTLPSLPCPLNTTLRHVLQSCDSLPVDSKEPPMALGRLQLVDLQRSDVTMARVEKLVRHSKRLRRVDVRHCVEISLSEWTNFKKWNDVEVVWE